MVITNSFYTKPAIELAKANDVELWNRDQLVKVLLLIKKNSPIKEHAATQEKPIMTGNEVCAVCDKPVSEKVKQYCLSNQNKFGEDVINFV